MEKKSKAYRISNLNRSESQGLRGGKKNPTISVIYKRYFKQENVGVVKT